MTGFLSRWAWPIIAGQTGRTALPIALIVGTLLVALNQGSAIIGGHIDATVIWRSLMNYVVPYIVSSIGYLRALNR